jgi:putative ABC transport system permease protein
MDRLLQDLRYAARSLVKDPGFAALTILCLALGIGVNSTIFSLVDTVAIRPLPFPDPDQLVRLAGTYPANGIGRATVSPADFRDWKEQTRAFADIAGISGRSFTIADGGGEPERVQGSLATWNLFPMLGIQPALGRQIRADEDTAGGPPVVLLSDGLWRRRYSADPAIIGRTITINATAHTVVGVMPPRFQFPQLSQLWVPQGPILAASPRSDRALVLFARMKPDMSLDAARRDVQSVADRLAAQYPEDKGWSATALTLRDDFMPSNIMLVVMTMMGAVTLVLLVACTNVANLLLARATVRQREIAVRAALGAGRGRIVRQLLTESVLIASASAPLGVLLAWVGLRWLTNSIPPSAQTPYYIDWDMNPRIVVYTAAIAVLTGLVFGLAPAIQALKTNVHDALKEGGRGSGGLGRHKLRHGLVVVEIALSLVLLVGASLFVRSFLNLQQASGTIDTSQLMMMRFFMAGDAYTDPDAINRRVDDIVKRVEAVPGVAAAMASNMVPLAGGGGGDGIIVEGAAVVPGEVPGSDYYAVTPHLFRTLRQPLIAGRDFTDAEGATKSGVAIVNTVFARKFWPKQSDVLGQRFRLESDKQNQWITVIGVVGDFRLFTVRDGTPPSYAFLPYPYSPTRNTGVTIRVAGGSPAAVTSAVRQEIRKSDPTLPVFQVQTGQEARENSYWQDRLFGWMFSIFAVVALALASVGVYGVLSYAVSQRRQEIGVRVALGASRGKVFGMVMALAAKLAGIGIALGVLGALGVTRVVKSLLYNVSTSDPLSFVATAVFLAAVALIASYVPARRATAVDPIVALRTE